MTPKLTVQDLRMLAQAERDMDRGAIPFVLWGGRRVAVENEAMAALGLEQGQTITDTIFFGLQEWQLACIKGKLAEMDVEEAARAEVSIGPDFLGLDAPESGE